MWEYCSTHWGEIASVTAIIVSIGGAIFWSHRLLHADIVKLENQTQNTNLRIDNAIQSFNSRMDAMYNVLMTHLLK